MITLGVTHVLLQDGTAWCQVLCRRGVLRLGNQFTRLDQPDGSSVEVNLTVQSIELASAPSAELDTSISLGSVPTSGC